MFKRLQSQKNKDVNLMINITCWGSKSKQNLIPPNWSDSVGRNKFLKESSGVHRKVHSLEYEYGIITVKNMVLSLKKSYQYVNFSNRVRMVMVTMMSRKRESFLKMPAMLQIISSFIPHITFVKCLLLFTFYGWRNWRSEMLLNSSRSPRWWLLESGFCLRFVSFQKHVSNLPDCPFKARSRYNNSERAANSFHNAVR